MVYRVRSFQGRRHRAIDAALDSFELLLSLHAGSVDLAGQGIQPIWLQIRNNEAETYALFPVELDPEYYSAHEAAWATHYMMSGEANGRIDAYFRNNR